MKKLLIISVGMLVSLNGLAMAKLTTFTFDPDDLIQLYPSSAGMSDVVGENKESQINARRTHQPWATNVYETFYNPAAPKPQADSYNSYMNWRDGLGAGEGISCFNIWLLDNPNARSWGEHLVSRLDAPAGGVTAAEGWQSEIVTNPWGAGYFAQWWTDNPDYYINTVSDIGEFSFTVDTYVDADGDGWDVDDPDVTIGDSYRIWFGAANYTEADGTQEWSVHFDDQGWGTRTPNDGGPWSAGLVGSAGYGSGYEGTLEIVATHPIPAPGAILLGSLGVSLVGWLRRRRSL